MVDYFILGVFIFIGILILLGVIQNIYYSVIPSSFIKVESEILYFEERIRWEDSSGSGGESSTPMSSPTYYEPVVNYVYLGEKMIYYPKKTFRIKSPDFNRKLEIFINPNNPKDARHRFTK